MSAPPPPDDTYILVVEDDPRVRLGLRLALESFGLRVATADGPDGALAAIRHADRAPALLISDIAMPGPGGVRFARALRQRYPELPLIFVTGDPEGSARDFAKLAPPMVVLPKPVSAETLLAHAERLCWLRA